MAVEIPVLPNIGLGASVGLSLRQQQADGPQQTRRNARGRGKKAQQALGPFVPCAAVRGARAFPRHELPNTGQFRHATA